MTNTKKTIRDFYADIRALAEENDRPDIVEFVDGRVLQLDKKNASGSKKQTATQVANENYKAEIFDFLASTGEAYTVGELRKKVNICVELDMSSSKVTALMRQLVASGKVASADVKGSRYYRAV